MLLKKETFVCVDCETTGLDVKEDRIIEVAVATFTYEKILDTYESLINPGCSIPEESVAIHNITNEMVFNQPSIEKILPKVFALVDDYPIVGHGVEFDIELLAIAAERNDISSSIRKNRVIDTLRMARLYGECPANSLECLRQHFNIGSEGAHRAMSDVIVNIEVFKQLGKDYKTLEQLLKRMSRPVALKWWPFGKYKGRSFSDVPKEYLKWASTKEFDQDLLYSIHQELKRRKKGNLFSQATNPFSDL